VPQLPIIECTGVTKHFYHYEHRTSSLQELFMRTVLRRPIHVRRTHFHLHDFTMQVQPGESVALIGSNGSGKSTALRLIAGIYPPSEGTIVRRGLVVAVIELGATFHPELTGAENIRLYAAALGLTRDQISEQFDEMVAFAEIEEFLHTPTKYYSSGMRARLAFSVAVCCNPDVLLLDEVLSVGDERFRQRCMDRITRFQAAGGTLLFVSHELDTVKRVCSRAVWLERGAIRLSGPADDVVSAYFLASGAPAPQAPPYAQPKV
jgi:ABC-type polysaccharide/polyol phosphate transport system ATPase subunit